MKFNRQLFKEGFKQGYKEAKKRLNEATLEGEEIPLNRVSNDVFKKIQQFSFNITIFQLLYCILDERFDNQKMIEIHELIDKGLKEDIATLVSLVHKYKLIKNAAEARKKFDRLFEDVIEHVSYEYSHYWTREWGVDKRDVYFMLLNNYDTLENEFIHTVL